MRIHLLWLMLITAAFSLSSTLEPRFVAWAGSHADANSLMQVALGDGRKLFANHFYTKADVYFHNGYYPTIYDNRENFKEAHMADGVRNEEEEEERENFLGKPKDWIDEFSRHFFPSRHTHLGDSGCGHSCCQRRKEDPEPNTAPDHCEHCEHDPERHEHSHVGQITKGDEREILPWLRLSAELDPQRVETYVVASFWLRSKLGRVDEAEHFLREGLQANPGDPEILFELGRISYENRSQVARARNLWELALKQWTTRARTQKEPDLLTYSAILNSLAMLEREQNNYPQAIKYYTALKQVSPSPASIQAWIDYLKTNGPPIKVGISAP